MDLTQLANLGEFIGGVAVIGSLIYVGLQVRQGTAQARVQATNDALANILHAFDPCYLPGNVEVFATGLRNPQELAFDEFGNLFTVDNNSDSGDRARLVHLVEGGDSGWTIGYQFITAPVSRGPWNEERLWEPRSDGQPAHIVPPLANLSDGPAGLAYYPGSGFPERFRGHFFLCDFRGHSGLSGIRTFTVRPKGASFALGSCCGVSGSSVTERRISPLGSKLGWRTR